jgi:hypothetical protein
MKLWNDIDDWNLGSVKSIMLKLNLFIIMDFPFYCLKATWPTIKGMNYASNCLNILDVNAMHLWTVKQCP